MKTQFRSAKGSDSISVGVLQSLPLHLSPGRCTPCIGQGRLPILRRCSSEGLRECLPLGGFRPARRRIGLAGDES